MTKISTTTSTIFTSSTSTTSTLCFDEVARSFTEKANAIVGKWKLAGPGSEYANMVAMHTNSAQINPTMGLKMHKNNPKGIKCTNLLCADLPCVDNHNLPHCYWAGRGMEDKAPSWIHNKSKPKTKTAIVTTTPVATTETANSVMEHNHRRELSCASLDISTLHTPHLAALLNPGTTSHIITN